VAANIKIEDLKKVFIEEAKSIETDIHKATRLAAKDIMEDIYNAAIVNILLKLQSKQHKHTNDILEAMYFKLIKDSKDIIIYEIGNTFQWASAIEYGTKPHIIKAKSKDRPLVFETAEYQDWNNWFDRAIIGRGGGYLKMTNIVHHPGAEPTYFLQQAILDYAPRFEKYLDKHLKDM